MSEATRTWEAFNAARRGLRDVWNREISRTMAYTTHNTVYTTHNTVNRLVGNELHLNPVVPERSKEE